MMIIGCDFHPSWQQVSWLETETGETGEQKLVQAAGDAERFYRQVPAPALIGMEATGNCHWLVDLLDELGHELWVGDAAQIRASYVRQQKTDKRDAEHILKLLVEGRFPRIWMPSSEVRDLRLWQNIGALPTLPARLVYFWFPLSYSGLKRASEQSCSSDSSFYRYPFGIGGRRKKPQKR